MLCHPRAIASFVRHSLSVLKMVGTASCWGQSSEESLKELKVWRGHPDGGPHAITMQPPMGLALLRTGRGQSGATPVRRHWWAWASGLGSRVILASYPQAAKGGEGFAQKDAIAVFSDLGIRLALPAQLPPDPYAPSSFPGCGWCPCSLVACPGSGAQGASP